MSKTIKDTFEYVDFENGSELTIKAMRPPIFVLAIYTIVSFGLLCGPLIAQAFWIVSGGRLSFGFFLFYSVMAIIGYFSLRLLLWNAFGKETFNFTDSEVRHQADFRFFKNQMKVEKIVDTPVFSKEFVGYEEDRNFALVIESNDWRIKGSAKAPEHKMDEIIALLQKKYS